MNICTQQLQHAGKSWLLMLLQCLLLLCWREGIVSVVITIKLDLVCIANTIMCVVKVWHKHTFLCDIEIWWPSVGKCRTRAAPSCDIFSLGFIISQCPLTTVHHLYNVNLQSSMSSTSRLDHGTYDTAVSRLHQCNAFLCFWKLIMLCPVRH